LQAHSKDYFWFHFESASTFPLFDITGGRFAHESAGEGEDRHLILERCPDTSM
jgi:hypothetical protein